MTHKIIRPYIPKQPDILAEIAKPRPIEKVPAEPPKDRANPPAIPDTNAEYFFLGNDFGKQIHERIIQKYAGIEAITNVTYDDNLNLVRGSNPFYVIAVNEELRTQVEEFSNWFCKEI